MTPRQSPKPVQPAGLSTSTACRAFASGRNRPKRLVIYEGANHGVGDAPSVANGEDKVTMLADWLLDRVNGKPVVSERVWIDSAGRAKAQPFG